MVSSMSAFSSTRIDRMAEVARRRALDPKEVTLPSTDLDAPLVCARGSSLPPAPLEAPPSFLRGLSVTSSTVPERDLDIADGNRSLSARLTERWGTPLDGGVPSSVEPPPKNESSPATLSSSASSLCDLKELALRMDLGSATPPSRTLCTALRKTPIAEVSELSRSIIFGLIRNCSTIAAKYPTSCALNLMVLRRSTIMTPAVRYASIQIPKMKMSVVPIVTKRSNRVTPMSHSLFSPPL
mmetsp:Transcript_1314/g.4881  ORF Transcript_1314/g.4881 Transcript_1314/m.4881 type:complete len:240 (-) Transcript_1314:1689-2408(-)